MSKKRAKCAVHIVYRVRIFISQKIKNTNLYHMKTILQGVRSVMADSIDYPRQVPGPKSP